MHMIFPYSDEYRKYPEYAFNLMGGSWSLNLRNFKRKIIVFGLKSGMYSN